jgi:hypothetical protein
MEEPSVSIDHVCIKRVSGEYEAQQIRALLEANGLICRLVGEALRTTHALTVDGLGEVAIEVPAADAERARELLQRAEAGDLSIGDDEDASR